MEQRSLQVIYPLFWAFKLSTFWYKFQRDANYLATLLGLNSKQNNGLTHIIEDTGEVPHSERVGIGRRGIHGAHASHDVTTTTATTCQAHRSLSLPGAHHMSLRRSPPLPSLSLATTPLTPNPVRPSRGYVHTTSHAVGAGACVWFCLLAVGQRRLL